MPILLILFQLKSRQIHYNSRIIFQKNRQPVKKKILLYDVWCMSLVVIFALAKIAFSLQGNSCREIVLLFH